MIRRPPRSTLDRSSAASDVYKRQQIDDLAAVRLSKEISKNIEDSMQYPGQIQVTVIRETRAVGFAK